MLQIIRERAQGLIVWTIVGLIIITFALFGLSSYLSGSSTNAIATVNGDNISQRDFQRAYRDYQDRLRQMLGANYRADMFKPAMVKQEVINGLVNQHLLTQYLADQKIYPADQLIAEEIHNIPAFKNAKGEFSNERYQELLQRQGMTPVGFEADLARDIAGQQLASALKNTAFVTAKELALYQRLKHQQRNVGYLLLEKSAYLGSAVVADADIEKYYQAHSNEFMTPEQVKLNYVELDLAKRSANVAIDEAKIKAYYETNRATYIKQQEQRKASHILIKVDKETDDATALAKLNALLAEYKAGKSFAELARKNSQDPGSARQGGDLGYFGRGVMNPAFEKAAFSLKKGEVSQPIKSRFGYHLILLTDSKPAVYRPYSEVKEQIKKQLQMTAAEQDFYVDAEKLDNLSYDVPDSLNAVVDELGLAQKQSPFFSRQGGRGLFANPKVIEAAFSDDVLGQGRNSSVIEISSTHLVVLRLGEHQAAQQKPLAEVKADIAKRLQSQAAQQQAVKDAQAVLAAIKAGGTASAWSKENKKGRWLTAGFIGRTASLDPLAEAGKQTQLPAELRQKAFEMSPSNEEQPSVDMLTLMNGDVAVLSLGKIKDVHVTEALTSQYRQQLQQAMGSADYNFFMQGLREEADISIHMDNIQE